MTRTTDGSASESTAWASRRDKRRALAASLARSIVVVTILVSGYYAAPVNAETIGAIVVRCVVAGVVIAVVVVWQIRSISRADRPAAQGIEGVAVVVTVMVLFFALVYVSMSQRTATAFSEPLGKTGALYFTMTTLTTVGFGDITARTDAARVAVMLQMISNVAVVGVAVRLILNKVRERALAPRP